MMTRRSRLMRLRPSLLFLLPWITVIACSSSPEDSQDTQGDTTTEDQTQIAALLERYETALNASDVDAVLELYAPDGVFMPSSAPTAEGADQVRASYEFVFSTIQLEIRFSIDEIEIHGDLAFARTGSQGTVKILADGTSAPEENRELFVFEKQGGEWKIARYMFNKTS